MAKAPRWRGPKTLQPGKQHWDFSATKISVTTDYTGPYSTCLNQRPQIGQTINQIGNGVRVSSVKVVELDAGAGRIDVTLEAEQESLGADNTVLGDPVYEIDWSELTKPMEANVYFAALSSSDRAKIEEWRAADTATARNAIKTAAAGNALLLKFLNKVEAGTDSYVVYQPIARRTTYYLYSPGAGECGMRQNPPAHCGAPNGYEYLKTADKVTREGRLRTRVEEWSGAESWDHELYN